MSPRLQKEVTISSLSGPTWTSLCGLPPKVHAVPWHSVHLKSGSFVERLSPLISCAPNACSSCRRCCCCSLQCDRQHMKTRLNSVGDPGPYHRSWFLSFLHLLLVLSPPLPLSNSRASWHIPLMIQRWQQGHRHRGPPRGAQNETRMAMLQAQWWRALVNTYLHFKYPSPTGTGLRALADIPCSSLTIHTSTPSFLSTHQMTFWGTIKCLLQSLKAM